MAFHIDDAVGESFSDASNDSFFELDNAKSNALSSPKKRSVSNLFGLKDDKKSISTKASNQQDDWLGLSDEIKNNKPPSEITLASTEPFAKQQGKVVKKISFEDDNILDILELDKAETKNAEKGFLSKKVDAGKKTVVGSIFGAPARTEEKVALTDDILKSSVVPKLKPSTPPPPSLKSTLAKTSEPQKSQGYVLSDIPREGRRSRHQISGIIDPLGLFADEKSKTTVNETGGTAASYSKQTEWSGLSTRDATEKLNIGEDEGYTTKTEVLFTVKPKDLKTKSVPNFTETPDWLVDSSPVKVHKSEAGILKIERPQQSRRNSTPTEVEHGHLKQLLHSSSMETPLLESLVMQQKLVTSQAGYQNTSIALQQQESQLVMALQLKKYEENLAEMQRQQQEILLKQEQHFNNLLERQFVKQQVMENNMKLQQERINNHIQMLISQPPLSVNSQEQENINNLKKNDAEQTANFYEDMIATLKERHREEMFLLEESYKKQISMLEETMGSIENRLKSELSNLFDQQNEKLQQIKVDHDLEIQKYKKKIAETADVHANELKLIQESQCRVIEEIKREYSTVIENLKQTRASEQVNLENASIYTKKLDDSLKMLDVNGIKLDEMREKVEKDYGVLSVAREESLKTREDDIYTMRKALEKCRETAESERSQLMGLVRSLETKLSEQNENAREERWALQQAAATLAARSAALDRESDFTRTSLERERDQIKTAKETILAEQEEVMLKLTEEKLALLAEKSRLETSAKLNQKYDPQKARAEIDAALKVAKEATELTDRERENLYRRQSEVESFHRQLADREHRLANKEREVEAVLRNAEKKAREGENALSQAKNAETKYNERLRDIQAQLCSLTNREKKLAEEKISLSKERLALHKNSRQLKRCSLCEIEDTSRAEDEIECRSEIVEHDFPRSYSVMDPEMLHLRHEVNESQDNSVFITM